MRRVWADRDLLDRAAHHVQAVEDHEPSARGPVAGHSAGAGHGHAHADGVEQPAVGGDLYIVRHDWDGNAVDPAGCEVDCTDRAVFFIRGVDDAGRIRRRSGVDDGFAACARVNAAQANDADERDGHQELRSHDVILLADLAAAAGRSPHSGRVLFRAGRIPA